MKKKTTKTILLIGVLLTFGAMALGSANVEVIPPPSSSTTQQTTSNPPSASTDESNTQINNEINQLSDVSTQTIDEISNAVNDALSETAGVSMNDMLDGLGMEEKNAVKEAQSYLNFSGFSRNGLIQQLSSEYGSGFTLDAATFAVNYLEDNNLVDWNEQAVREAKSYLEFSSFSRAGMIEQLSSEYGSQFTKEQAEYAVSYLESNGMVDWYEQAVKEGQSYLNVMSYSRSGLIEQLSSEYGSKFTVDQAEYAVNALGY